MEQIVKVHDYGELHYALEVLNAKIIEVDGMIDCGKNPLSLKPGQILRGATQNSHLAFSFQTARSAIVTAAGSRLEQLKINVAAAYAPQDNQVKAAIVVNGVTGFHEVEVFAKIEQEETVYPRHLYVIMFLRSKAVLSGKIVLHGVGNCVGGIYGDKKDRALFEFEGEELSLFLCDSLKSAIRQCKAVFEKGKFTYFYNPKNSQGEDEFIWATVLKHRDCLFEHNAQRRITETEAGNYAEIEMQKVPIETTLPKKRWLDWLKFWKK